MRSVRVLIVLVTVQVEVVALGLFSVLARSRETVLPLLPV